MENTIRVLKIEPGKAPYVKEIEKDYRASQREVGGLIDCFGFGDGCIAVLNDESKINGMEPNRRCRNDIICGPFFICGDARVWRRTFHLFSGKYIEKKTSPSVSCVI